jgi:hypothetical protein
VHAQNGVGQSQERKAEIGAQFTVLKVSTDQEGEFALPNDIQDTLLGGGLRFGYNITDNLAIETEGSIFVRPSDREGRRSQGLFGIKLGARREAAGFFAKVRPGFIRFDRILTSVRGNPNVQERTNVYFALDIGGVVEVYPSPRSIVRLDIGDTIVRITNRHIEGFEPGAIPILRTKYSHNFQLSAGVGFRF